MNNEDESNTYTILLSRCANVVHAICKNIWTQHFPESVIDNYNSDGNVLHFEIPPGERLPRKVLVAFCRQMNNAKRVGKVMAKIEKCDQFLHQLEIDDVTNTNPVELGDTVCKSLRHQWRILLRCEAALARAHSLCHRVTELNFTTETVYVSCITDLDSEEALLDVRERYLLLDNRNPDAWKIRNFDGEEQFVSSLFLCVNTKDVELAKLQRSKEKLLAISEIIISQCCRVFLRVSDAIISHSELLTRFFPRYAEYAFLRTLRSMQYDTRNYLRDERGFSNADAASVLRNLTSIEETLGKEQLEKFKQQQSNSFTAIYADAKERFIDIVRRQMDKSRRQADENASMYLRLVKISRLADAMKRLIQMKTSSRHLSRSSRRRSSRPVSRVSEDTTDCGLVHGTSVLEFDIELEEVIEEERKVLTAKSETFQSSDLDAPITETVIHSSGEVQQSFVIDSVHDGQLDEQIPLNEAVQVGLIDYHQGQYVDNLSGRHMPIAEAMETGKILVETHTSKELSSEKTSSYGVITINQTKTDAPFLIRLVRHPESGRAMTLRQAVDDGIVDEENSIYRNPDTGKEVQLKRAISEGLVEVEQEEPDLDTTAVDRRTWVINGVVDRKLRRRISFKAAMTIGLVDRETGAYIDNVSGERVYPAEAIKRGFFKAKQLEKNDNVLDIDPDNRIVVEKFKRLQTKWAAIRAFGGLQKLKAAAAAQKV